MKIIKFNFPTVKVLGIALHSQYLGLLLTFSEHLLHQFWLNYRYIPGVTSLFKECSYCTYKKDSSLSLSLLVDVSKNLQIFQNEQLIQEKNNRRKNAFLVRNFLKVLFFCCYEFLSIVWILYFYHHLSLSKVTANVRFNLMKYRCSSIAICISK